MNRNSSTLAACLLALAIPLSSRAAPDDDVARFKPWGVDLTVMDRGVKPGDDFDRYVNGKWNDTATIPADQSSTGIFDDVYNLTQRQLQSVIDGAPATSPIGLMTASFMDTTRLETLDSSPLRADLAAIAAAPDRLRLAELNTKINAPLGHPLFDVDVSADLFHPELNGLYLGQSDIGLPDRDYYLQASLKPKLDAYRAYVGRALAMAGYAKAEAYADKIVAFETAIAKVDWSRTERRDLDKSNNPMTLAELEAYAPGFPWKALFTSSGIADPGTIIVGENTAIKAAARLYSRTPLDTLKAWMAFHTIWNASPYLSARFVDSRFELTKALNGSPSLPPRWKRAQRLLDGSLGEVVGRAYTDRWFPQASKDEMLRMNGFLAASMAKRIRDSAWMADSTKTEALAKLSAMIIAVGYPDHWRDYSALQIDATDLVGNVRRSNVFDWQYHLADLRRPVDRGRWGMTPQTVNASNNGVSRKLTFPAGILQPPLFSLAADPAVNYGSAGAIIGHEISHSFDDQGRKIDSTGTLRDWWTPSDAEQFKAQAATLGKQYDGYEPLPGLHINGTLTMGENIADLAGIRIALDAYHASLGGQPAPVIDGLTGDQRFFLAFGQVWRAKQRDDAMRQQVTSDPHTPARYRVNGVVRNVDAWYAAFDVKPGDALYLAPEQRARIW